MFVGVGGGEIQAGMDSLINNHYLFLPDPNWSHTLTLKPGKALC